MNIASAASTRRQAREVLAVESKKVAVLHSVTLTIAGHRITLRTDKEEKYLLALAEELNASMDELRRAAPSATSPQLMALLAVQILDQLKQTQLSSENKTELMLNHAERLASILDALDSGAFQSMPSKEL